MLKVSIDTCILLDLLLDQDPESIARLARHRRNHDELVICGMVYGELFPILLRNRIDTALFLSEMNHIRVRNECNVFQETGFIPLILDQIQSFGYL